MAQVRKMSPLGTPNQIFIKAKFLGDLVFDTLELYVNLAANKMRFPV